MTTQGTSGGVRSSWFAALLRDDVRQVIAALVITGVLFGFGALVSPSSVGTSALAAMLPFAAILGLAAIGQQIVIVQRGLDLSSPGIISLAAVLVTILPAAMPLALAGAIGAALAVALLCGLANGVAIVVLRIPPLVATIGVNSLLFGAVLRLTHGTPSAAPPALARYALERTLGLPNTVWVALVFSALMIFFIRVLPLGRRFVAVGLSPAAAHATGLPVEAYLMGTYLVAGLCYGVAGILLAGLLNVPNLFVGGPYLLATVAAVVLGGSALTGGHGSILATLVGAVFLTQLDQILVTVGFDRSIQFVAQGLIVIAGAGLHARMGSLGFRKGQAA